MKRLDVIFRGGLVAALAAGAGACVVPRPIVVVPVDRVGELAYEDAVGRAAVRQALDDRVAVAGGRSILLTHGARTARVYVLLHGFSDAPTQFEAIGRALFADGDNVYIPRLPHHAERAEPLRSLGRVRAAELASFGDSCVAIARGLGDTVVVVGLSAGGDITGWLAQSNAGVRRAVLIAPAIAPGRVAEDDALGLVMLASKLPDVERGRPADTTRLENVQGITTRGLDEVLRLGYDVHERAAGSAPAVMDIAMLLNEGDHTVNEAATIDVAQRWRDHGASVVVYRFAASARLPHNMLELTPRGGHTEVVYPVVEALARGAAPSEVPRFVIPCGGWKCDIRRWARLGRGR